MTPAIAREQAQVYGLRERSDLELLQIVGNLSATSTGLLVNVEGGIRTLAWRTPQQLAVQCGVTEREALKIAAAFELGRRGAWDRPQRGERCLDPSRVYELLRAGAQEQSESFWIVLLDVRGRLLSVERISKGSLTQCPVNPRDCLRPAVSQGAHGIVFAHNHPSGDPSPSPEDVDLTERLRAAAEIVGICARDHVIVAAQGYYSFVEAGRWGRR